MFLGIVSNTAAGNVCRGDGTSMQKSSWYWIQNNRGWHGHSPGYIVQMCSESILYHTVFNFYCCGLETALHKET